MGLDMYLYTKKEIDREVKEGEYRKEIAYWRKANQIHRWFVENFQDEDNCEMSGIIKAEDLERLQKLCKKIIVEYEKKGTFTLARKLLPCQGGFFFGCLEYDEGYIEGLKETVEKLERILVNPEPEGYIYWSSW